MTAINWPSAWLKGFLELAVLAIIGDGENYGYEITSHLEARGFGVIKGGTLYPVLGRLEDGGLVEAEWRAGDSGPGRKYYRLTPEGEAQLAERTQTWLGFSDNLTTLLKG